MSGNQPVDAPPDPASTGFPAVGQYDVVPGPGDPGYVEPDPDPELDVDPADPDPADADTGQHEGANDEMEVPGDADLQDPIDGEE